MRSLSSVGLGLSVVFCCLLLALMAEVYYLLWWKRRWNRRDGIIEDDFSSPARELLYMLCCRRQTPASSRAQSSLSLNPQQQQQLVKSFDENSIGVFERQLVMAPRFLFTIREETKEDLESEDGKSGGHRSRSLSDLLRNMGETPYVTPLASPPYLTPPLTPPPASKGLSSSHNYSPFNEYSSDAEFNKIRASPPPMFKFLREAEEKLERRRMMMEEEEEEKKGKTKAPTSTTTKVYNKNEGDGSFVTIIIPKSNETQPNRIT
ncbi:hypothetical protein Ancab_001511 [Ancistrocladus abbreviatus]